MEADWAHSIHNVFVSFSFPSCICIIKISFCVMRSTSTNLTFDFTYCHQGGLGRTGSRNGSRFGMWLSADYFSKSVYMLMFTKGPCDTDLADQVTVLCYFTHLNCTMLGWFSFLRFRMSVSFCSLTFFTATTSPLSSPLKTAPWAPEPSHFRSLIDSNGISQSSAHFKINWLIQITSVFRD